ncbi:MAG: Carbonic anhydrase or acetyltransferase, isoleucine patch superfamily [Segetibacter sp.]|nr:Carbonic anhydrase or acetyltransferase, isoleucine patch superfamily [Segetibacter sp.]
MFLPIFGKRSIFRGNYVGNGGYIVRQMKQRLLQQLKTVMKIHPLADVQSAAIGEKTTIWQYAIVLPGAVIGENCNINCHTFIENKVVVGNNVTVKSGVQLWDGISVEDDVFIGPNVTFTNDIVPRSKVYPGIFKSTLIKKGASIGANSTIVAGVVISEYSLVGAGSVVTKDIPPYSVWYGNPAKHKGYVTADGKLLDLNLKDKDTNEQYRFQNERLVVEGTV